MKKLMVLTVLFVSLFVSVAGAADYQHTFTFNFDIFSDRMDVYPCQAEMHRDNGFMIAEYEDLNTGTVSVVLDASGLLIDSASSSIAFFGYRIRKLEFHFQKSTYSANYNIWFCGIRPNFKNWPNVNNDSHVKVDITPTNIEGNYPNSSALFVNTFWSSVHEDSNSTSRLGDYSSSYIIAGSTTSSQMKLSGEYNKNRRFIIRTNFIERDGGERQVWPQEHALMTVDITPSFYFDYF